MSENTERKGEELENQPKNLNPPGNEDTGIDISVPHNSVYGPMNPAPESQPEPAETDEEPDKKPEAKEPEAAQEAKTEESNVPENPDQKTAPDAEAVSDSEEKSEAKPDNPAEPAADTARPGKIDIDISSGGAGADDEESFDGLNIMDWVNAVQIDEGQAQQSAQNQIKQIKRQEKKQQRQRQEKKIRPWFSIFKNPGLYGMIIAVILAVLFVRAMRALGLFSASTVLGAAGLAVLLLGLALFIFFMQPKRWVKIFGWILVIGVGAASFFGTESVGRLVTDLQKVCAVQSPADDEAGIYVYSQVPLSSLESLSGQTIGMLSKKNQVYNNRILEYLDEQGITVKTSEYENYTQMMRALKGQAIRAVILTSGDVEMAGEFTGLESFASELTLFQSFGSDAGVTNDPTEVDVTKDSFNILLSASTSPVSQTYYRSSTNIVITINPTARKVLFTYIPRSLQTVTACPEGLSCDTEHADKISLASYHSIEALSQTVAALLDIDINYTLRVDLDSLTNYIDELGTITITNPTEYTSGSYLFKQGELEMDAAFARKYAGDINDFSASDVDYEINQYRVLMAILSQADTGSYDSVVSLIDTLSSSVRTNMSYSDLIQCLRMFYLRNYVWEQYGCSIAGTENWAYSYALTDNAFAITADEDSLASAKSNIQSVLDGNTPADATLLEDGVSLADIESANVKAMDEDEAYEQQQAQAEKAEEEKDTDTDTDTDTGTSTDTSTDTSSDTAAATDDSQTYYDYSQDYNSGYYTDPNQYYYDYSQDYSSGYDYYDGYNNYYNYDPYSGYYGTYDYSSGYDTNSGYSGYDTNSGYSGYDANSGYYGYYQ